MNFIDETSVKGYNYKYIQYDPMLGIKNYLIFWINIRGGLKYLSEQTNLSQNTDDLQTLFQLLFSYQIKQMDRNIIQQTDNETLPNVEDQTRIISFQ